MKNTTTIIALLLFCLLLSNNIMAQNANMCKDLTLLPMYGNRTVCKEQQRIDKQFVEHCIEVYSSRRKASEAYVEKGWNVQRGDEKSGESMVQYMNKAWLLDSLNADVYWGFGVCIGNDQEYEESNKMFLKSLKLNPKNQYVWFWIAINYNDLYRKTADRKYEKLKEQYLKEAERLDPQTNFRERIETPSFTD